MNRDKRRVKFYSTRLLSLCYTTSSMIEPVVFNWLLSQCKFNFVLIMSYIKKKDIPFLVPFATSVIAFFYIPSPSEYSDENHVYVKAFDTYIEVLSASSWFWIIIPFFIFYMAYVHDLSDKSADSAFRFSLYSTFAFISLWLFCIQLSTEFHIPCLLLLASSVYTFMFPWIMNKKKTKNN